MRSAAEAIVHVQITRVDAITPDLQVPVRGTRLMQHRWPSHTHGSLRAYSRRAAAPTAATATASEAVVVAAEELTAFLNLNERIVSDPSAFSTLIV